MKKHFGNQTGKYLVQHNLRKGAIHLFWDSFFYFIFLKVTSISTNVLSKQVQQCVQGILDSESATKLAELEALAGTWDGELRQVSK